MGELVDGGVYMLGTTKCVTHRLVALQINRHMQQTECQSYTAWRIIPLLYLMLPYRYLPPTSSSLYSTIIHVLYLSYLFSSYVYILLYRGRPCHPRDRHVPLESNSSPGDALFFVGTSP